MVGGLCFIEGMDVLTAPATLRYIASEGAAPAPRDLRLHVYRKGDKVFVCLNGITMTVHDSGSYHCLPPRFTEVELGAFHGVWSSSNTFDVDFVATTLNTMSSIPVGLSVDVCVNSGFENELVAIPQLECTGVFVSKNRVRLLFPPSSIIKACIRNPQYTTHSTHESVAEMRAELLPRVPFCPNKCTMTVRVNAEQQQIVCQYFSVLMGETGSWRQCFTALLNQNLSKQAEQALPQQGAECLATQ